MSDIKIDSLSEILKDKYRSHRAVAKALGITEEHYYRVRTGRGNPSYTLVKLMEQLAG